MYRRTFCLIGVALWVASAQAPPPAGRGGGLSAKNPALPANLFTSASTLAHTSLRHEWVDIPMGTAKLHTWIEYPAGEAKAPLVLLMHYDAGSTTCNAQSPINWRPTALSPWLRIFCPGPAQRGATMILSLILMRHCALSPA